MTLLPVTPKAWCGQNPESVAAFFAERGSISINNGPSAVGRAAIAKEAQTFPRHPDTSPPPRSFIEIREDCQLACSSNSFGLSQNVPVYRFDMCGLILPRRNPQNYQEVGNRHDARPVREGVDSSTQRLPLVR